MHSRTEVPRRINKMDAVGSDVAQQPSTIGHCCWNHTDDSQPFFAWNQHKCIQMWLNNGLGNCVTAIDTNTDQPQRYVRYCIIASHHLYDFINLKISGRRNGRLLSDIAILLRTVSVAIIVRVEEPSP